MVKRESNGYNEFPATRMHTEKESATKEAIRLSRLHPECKFFILEYTGIYVKSTIETLVETEPIEYIDNN